MPRYIFTNVGRGNVFRQARAFLVSKSIAFTYGRRGWVEIGESDGKIDEKYRLRLAFPGRKWMTVFPESHTPVTFLKKQNATATRIKSAEGYSGGWPDKWWIRVDFGDVVLYNGHMPPGAFNQDHDERYEKQRLEEWHHMWDMLKDNVKKDHDNRRNVVIMTDANRQVNMPLPHPRAKIANRHKTDYIWAVPKDGWQLDLGKTGEKELGIDFHKSIWADIDWARSR